LILAGDGAGFLVDCGSTQIIEKIRELMREGRLHSVDGLFITHYHDDHTDQAAAAAREFECPVYTCSEMEDILKNPSRFRLPCLTKNPIPALRVMPEGGTLQWKEFEFSFFYFPGQTIHHGSLLVKKRNGETIFFIGDSFTPCGIDDYCLLNRNLLHSETGYFHCLDRIRQMKPDYLLINQHVVPTFRFSEEQLDFMRKTLEKRVELLRALFAWDDPNYGIDEGWAVCYPYAQHALPGETTLLALNVMNHSSRSRVFRARLRGPEGWETGSAREVTIPSRTEGSIRFEVIPLRSAAPGLYLITADLQSEGIDLREWSEAMIQVESSP
jgi:glyoxylase-like metal-dependent hydrolase (beta-lactamase superfamily II)